MNVSEINWPAVRAFAKIFNPISDAHAEAALWNAGFDGGEFSEEVYYRVLDLVADRFGVTPEGLEEMIMLAGYHEWNCFLSRPRSGRP